MSKVTDLITKLEALESPTPDQVAHATHEYTSATAAAAAAYEALNAGGEPQPGAPVVRGPFSFAYNTPNLNDGVPFYTPTINDILLNGWIEVTTAFNGTTPFPDIGTFVDTTGGLINGSFDLSAADDEHLGTGLLTGPAAGNKSSPLISLNSEDHRFVPLRVTAANPLKIVVSQDGLAGGTAVGGTTGAADIYIVTATPIAP